MGCYHVVIDGDEGTSQMAHGYVDAIALVSDIIQDERGERKPGLFSLTARQRECYDVIERAIAVNGVGPTMEEIADAIDLKSKAGVHRLVVALEDRGWLKRLEGEAMTTYKVLQHDGSAATAGAAARAADWDAATAGAAAGSAAWAAEREWQNDRLFDYLEGRT